MTLRQLQPINSPANLQETWCLAWLAVMRNTRSAAALETPQIFVVRINAVVGGNAPPMLDPTDSAYQRQLGISVIGPTTKMTTDQAAYYRIVKDWVMDVCLTKKAGILFRLTVKLPQGGTGRNVFAFFPSSTAGQLFGFDQFHGGTWALIQPQQDLSEWLNAYAGTFKSLEIWEIR